MVTALLLIITIALYICSNLFVKAYQMHAGVNKMQMNMYNSISALAAFLLLFFIKGFSLSHNPITLLLAISDGVILCIYYTSKVLAISEGPIALVTMGYVLGGFLLPAIFGFVFLNEPVTWLRVIGLVCACAAFAPTVISQFKKGGDSPKLTPKFFLYWFILFLFNGFIMCCSKTAQLVSPDSSWSMDFVALYYLFYFVCSLIPLTVQAKHYTAEDMSATFTAKGFIFMVVSGASCALAAALNVSLAFRLPASVQFPVLQTSLLVGVTLVSIFLFREKPPRSTVISLVISVLAIVLLSV